MTMSDEATGAEFGDLRLSKRLVKLVAQLEDHPADSLPQAMDSDGELEAAYRFLNHDEVEPERILAPHIAATCRRAAGCEQIIVAHDTTEFGYSSDREGLGRVTDGGHGFFGHFALAMSADEKRVPLGIVGFEPLFRRKPARRKGRQRHSEKRLLKDRESCRWGALVEDVEEHLSGRVSAIHVMDREADGYELFAQLIANKRRFVIRLKHNRYTEDPSSEQPRKVEAALQGLTAVLGRSVPLSRRKTSTPPKPQHPPRAERVAKLEVCATRLIFRAPFPRPKTEEPLPETLELSVVHVREVETAAGCEAIDWKLISCDPIDTPEQVAAIVDAYRARWVIEEFFKALKTGCAVEKRQLESAHALLNMIAVFVPIAWNLLRLRHLCRAEESASAPASQFLPALQIRLLQRHKKSGLCQQPTLRDALLAIARLGGHLRRNGDPGWQTLGSGYETLLSLEAGARLAQDLEL